MKKNTLHLKFAKAIFNLAKNQQKTAEFFEQLTELSNLMTDQNLVKALERMSGLEQSKLLDLLKKSFPEGLAEEMYNLLILLINNRQIDLLPAIKNAYQRFYFEAEQIFDFLVCSSRELTEEEKQSVVEALGASKKIHATFTVDQGLIGGIQIYENGKLTDYSIKNQLEHLRRLLMGEHIV